MMEKKILASGKELAEMRICPECGERGLIEQTYYACGFVDSYIFKCDCGCTWECETEACKKRRKEKDEMLLEHINYFKGKQSEHWYLRLLRR